MDKKLKAKWVKALESGKYRRARGQLKTDSGYCCLGVLCAITKTPFDETDGRLPLSLLQMTGITNQQQSALIGLNDGELDEDDRELLGLKDDLPRYRVGKGVGFKTIAKVIRESL
jgi:hypothetical protein